MRIETSAEVKPTVAGRDLTAQLCSEIPCFQCADEVSGSTLAIIREAQDAISHDRLPAADMPPSGEIVAIEERLPLAACRRANLRFSRGQFFVDS
jgi:hypothetical protein